MLPEQLPPRFRALLEALTPWKNIKFDRYDGGQTSGNDDRQPADLWVDAQVVSSRVPDLPDDIHAVAIDIDHHAWLIPSSTPDHHHLYIDVAIKWDNYKRLLDVLADCGIIERGYAEASKRNGGTFLRVPWLKKGMEKLPTLAKIEEWLNDEPGT